jgi:uncharacterized protein (TIGR02147 family)
MAETQWVAAMAKKVMSKFSDFIKSHEEGARSLLESPDAKTFLKNFFAIKKSLNPSYSFAVFATKAGISKSLPRDVIEGLKRITEKSLPHFLQGMELDGLMQEFFIQLVESEKDPIKLKLAKKIADLYIETHFTKTFTDNNFKDHRSPFLYAASGEVGKGVKLSLLAERTGMSIQNVKEAIPQLEKLKLGSYNSDDDTFTPSTPQVHIDVNANGPSHFFSFYHYCLSLQREIAEKKFQAPETFFYNEVFSIHEKDLVNVKAELRNVIKSFLIKAENPQGDSVAVFNLGLFKQTFQDS